VVHQIADLHELARFHLKPLISQALYRYQNLPLQKRQRYCSDLLFDSSQFFEDVQVYLLLEEVS